MLRAKQLAHIARVSQPASAPATPHALQCRRPGLVIVIAAFVAATAAPTDHHRDAHRGPLGEAGGAVPAGTTVFDDALPAVANLRPALLAALRRAATDAARNGVGFVVDGGW